MDDGASEWTSGRGATAHYVTLRLIDALPRSAVEAWHDEIDRSLARMGRAHPDARDERAVVLKSLGIIDRYLDAGRGVCTLRDPQMAEVIQRVLCEGNGANYRLHAWCVMPNHVHALVSPCAATDVDAVVKGWKSETTRAISRATGRPGAQWHAEVITYAVSHPLEFERIFESIVTNPTHARMGDWPYVGAPGKTLITR